MHIKPEELSTAQEYIQQHFSAHSWWPKEQPAQALHEFTLMQQDTIGLSAWCEKWLDAGQCRQLANALKKA